MRNMAISGRYITNAMLIPSMLVVLLLGMLFSILNATAISEQEAEKIFNKHCSICHNGVTAVDFNKLLEKLRDWASKYSDIDTAVKQEYGAENYDALMKEMKRMTPTISDEEFKKLYDFFKNYFEKMRQAKPLQPTATITLTVVQTVTKTSPVYAHATLTIKEGAPGETVKLISTASLVSVAIIAIAIILLVYRIKTLRVR